MEDNKSVIYITTIGLANHFPYSEDEKNVDSQQVKICDEEALNRNPFIRTYDGKPFVINNCYIEHPFNKNIYILLDDANKVEAIIQKDRDNQIEKIVGMLGATYYRCKLHTTKYKYSRLKAELKARFGLFRSKVNAEFNEETNEESDYSFDTSFTKGGNPDVDRAKTYLIENHLENDIELNRLIEDRDSKIMGEGHIVKTQKYSFDYTQDLMKSLEAAMSLSKVKCFKVDANIETQTKIRVSKKLSLNLYYDGAEKEEKAKDLENVKNGIMSQKKFDEKWN